MELKLSRQPLFINDIVLDTEVEQPIECDALLPDYCPDIVRILKCTVQPTITTRRVSGLRLELEGVACITIHYVSGGDGIAKGEYKVPFARTIELKAEPQNPVVSVGCRVSYVNCRAVNQRRLDIRGAVALQVQVISCREDQVITQAEGMGVQLKRDHRTATRILGQGSRDTHFSETLELSYGKAPIQSIVRSRGGVTLSECRPSGGKAVVKGELTVRLLYCTTAGAWDQMEYTLPLSAIVEIDGLDDMSQCDVSQELMSLSLEPSQDNDGEYRCIQLEAVVLTTVRAHADYEAVTCSDCYSTRNQCSFHTKTVNSQRLGSMVRDPFTYKESMPLPENVESIIDLWCEVAGCESRAEPDGVTAVGRLTVCMFAKMRDGEIFYFDKPLEVERKVPADEGNLVFQPRLNCGACGYTFTANDAIEVRCDLQLDGPVYATQRTMLVDDITVDEKKGKTDVAAPGLYIYMADGGETLWDIAKRYNTSIDKIMEENGDQQTENGCNVLLIPVL